MSSSSSSEQQQPCTHYDRHCKLVCPQCDVPSPCRLCHDSQNEDHRLDRFAVSSVVCNACHTRQPKALTCSNCSISFGKYGCLVCCLFDDREHGQFHCDGCRLCRVGGRENFFHCDTCGCCLPNSNRNHQCVQSASDRPCSVCLEDIHSSRLTAHVPSCHHLLHMPCFEDLVQKGNFACPTCGKSMLDMTQRWKELDTIVQEIPMPAVYRGICCQVLCKDCNKESIVSYHIEAMKCKLCGSYNTTRSGGSLLRKKKGSALSDAISNYLEQQWAESSGQAASGSSQAQSSPTTAATAAAPAVAAATATAAAPVDGAAAGAADTSNTSSNWANISSASVSDSSAVSEAPAAAAGASSAPQRTRLNRPTAGQEIHMYEAVDAEALEREDSPVTNMQAILQGFADGMDGLVNFIDDDDDDDDDDFGDDHWEPAISVMIDGVAVGIEEAEASEWETDDEGENGADGEDNFDTADSD